MPVSKRDRVVHTSKVKKHSKDEKSIQIDAVRSAVEEMRYAYVVTVSNERNSIIKAVRDELKPGKMFYSKNKLVQLALGFSPETECADGICGLSAHLVGHSALVLSNLGSSEIHSILTGHDEEEFARAGGLSTSTVELSEGFDALASFPHSMETQFRKLGLPTSLYDGKIKLLANHQVCTEGDVLTAAQAQVLKLLNIKMAKFEMRIKAVWDKESSQISISN